MKHTTEQQLEEQSKSALRNLVTDIGWIYREKNPDKGIDVEIEIVESEEVTNKLFWIQLKSTESIDGKKEISYPMKTKHLKYYSGCPLPVFILYWIKPKNKFYYIFAQKYMSPVQKVHF